MRCLCYVLVCVFITACGSAPKKIEPSKPVDIPTSGIDYIGLQRSLGMEIPADRLGYKEKTFNTCEAGYGYSGTHNCRREYMVVVNFRLQCRDSVGQVSEGVNNSDLTPIVDKSVVWNLKGVQGTTRTDSEGFGQIMTVSSISQRQQRLKLAVGKEFLYMRANEITRVVTPRPWCEQ